MKKSRFILGLSLMIGALASCGPKLSVSISYDSGDALSSFAFENIEKAVKTKGGKVSSKGAYSISFKDVDSTLGEQSYKIEVDNKNISITGGDKTGLMYGGLDVAETIEMYGMGGIKAKNVSPDMEYRGLKFNIPLDMRTPSYTDGGDSGQNNIPVMWDKEFWKEEFNLMALNRYNALSIWSLNPFASMVKVNGYEDCALNDVWRTTLKFDGSYNGTASDLVREEHWQQGNYEVVKTITIDEKIAFWKDVMSMAHDRGIKFYMYTWNVYTFAENGKYSITCDQDNPATKDYYRKAVEAFLDTYPDLDGFGIGAGENMKTPETAGGNAGSVGYGDEENEIWLHDTYGEGIKASLAKTPNRDFEVVHRMHFADGESLAKIWGDLPCKFNLSDKYATAHMYASEEPHLIDPSLEGMVDGQKLWLELRNDDAFHLRYGGVDFARALVTKMPVHKGIKGFLMGSDGYVQGKAFDSALPDFKGQLYMGKHWYNYMLFGRIAYENNLTNAFFSDKLAAHYKDMNRSVVDNLFNAMNSAGSILPNANMLFYVNGDSWYPEGNWTNSNTFGYVGIKRLVSAKSVHPYGNVISIPEYCGLLETNGTTSLRTPADIIINLNTGAKGVDDLASSLKSASGKNTEFDQMVLDQISFANLGKYYALKYEAAIALRLYNDTQGTAKKAEAVAKATDASNTWKVYANDMIARFGDAERLSRAGIYSFSNVTAEVEKDISVCEKWTPRAL